MAELRNEFSWSKSRSRMFADCKRLYWFNVYGKWGGWEAGADPRTRELYLLGQLKSRHMWAGEVVHAAVATILRAYRDGELIDPDTVLKGLRVKMRQDFQISRAQKFRTPGNAKCCALREHEYKETVAKEEWERVASQVEGCLRNFIASDLFGRLKKVRTEDWLAVDEPKPSMFLLDGIKVWVKVDAAYRSGKGLHIIDWKTGASEDELGPLQLAVYSLYAKNEWLQGGEGRIYVGLCELADDRARFVESEIPHEDLEAARRQIREETERMAALLVSTREENKAKEEQYPGTDTPKTCRSCNFQRVCPVSLIKFS